MAEENLNQVTGIGGATAKSLSAPQLRPIRSYKVEGCGGTIYVYVFTTQLGMKVAVLTYHDPYYANKYEYVYAASLIVGTNTGLSLLRDASNLFEKLYPDAQNPFILFALEGYEKELELVNTIATLAEVSEA